MDDNWGTGYNSGSRTGSSPPASRRSSRPASLLTSPSSTGAASTCRCWTTARLAPKTSTSSRSRSRMILGCQTRVTRSFSTIRSRSRSQPKTRSSLARKSSPTNENVDGARFHDRCSDGESPASGRCLYRGFASNACDVWGAVPEILLPSASLMVRTSILDNGRRNRGTNETQTISQCDNSENWITQLKLIGSYTLPYDVQVAATVQNQPGPERVALVSYGTSTIAPILGVPPPPALTSSTSSRLEPSLGTGSYRWTSGSRRSSASAERRQAAGDVRHLQPVQRQPGYLRGSVLRGFHRGRFRDVDPAGDYPRAPCQVRLPDRLLAIERLVRRWHQRGWPNGHPPFLCTVSKRGSTPVSSRVTRSPGFFG